MVGTFDGLSADYWVLPSFAENKSVRLVHSTAYRLITGFYRVFLDKNRFDQTVGTVDGLSVHYWVFTEFSPTRGVAANSETARRRCGVVTLPGFLLLLLCYRVLFFLSFIFRFLATGFGERGSKRIARSDVTSDNCRIWSVCTGHRHDLRPVQSRRERERERKGNAVVTTRPME